MTRTLTKKIPILDLNLAAFLLLSGQQPELRLEGSRIGFHFSPNSEFQQLTTDYNRNVLVPVLDFVSATRQLRSMMLALRSQS